MAKREDRCIAGWFRSLAATDGDNNFKLVAIKQLCIGVLTARHNFTVAFNGNAFAGEFQCHNKAGDGKRRGELARFAIDGKCNHWEH